MTIKTNSLAKILSAATVVALLSASSSVFAQVKIGTNPATIDATNNLEVEASTSGRKTSINKTTGQVTIADGTQGAGKILTSDANGGASWQVFKNTTINSFQETQGFYLGVAAGQQTSTCPVTANPNPCSRDLNQDATFTINNSVNDVLIDIADNVVIAQNSTPVGVALAIYVDKTTPGVFELVGDDEFTIAATGCSANTITYKAALKNLPVRSTPYTSKVYAYPRYNGYSGATNFYIAVGVQIPGTGCGANGTGTNFTVVTVSQ